MHRKLFAGFVTVVVLGLASTTALANRATSRPGASSSASASRQSATGTRSSRATAAGRAAPTKQAALGRANTRSAARTTTARRPAMSATVRAEVTSRAASMESFIRGVNDTPRMEIISASPRATLTNTHWGDYKNDVPRFSVTGLGATGQLSLVTLMPVSGHNGAQAARGYARSNRYNVVVTHANGRVETLPKVASTGYVTDHTLNLTLKRGKTVIQFWPEGSGGVGGYRAGREVHIQWDGR